MLPVNVDTPKIEISVEINLPIVDMPTEFNAPVKLPVTFPVSGPIKLVDVVTPETLRASSYVCPSISIYPFRSIVVNVPAVPVILPDTFPVRGPTKLVAVIVPLTVEL